MVGSEAGSDFLTILANVSAIATAVVAVVAAIYLGFDRRNKRVTLEGYLKKEKQEAKGDNKGQRSLLHLMARLGMTEAELLQASFRSKKIARRLSSEKETGHASALLLEYKDDGA